MGNVIKKRTVGQVVAFFLAFVIGSMMFTQASSACDCIVAETVEEALEQADAVFTAEVLAVRENYVSGSRTSLRERVLLEVGTIWKGIDTSQAVIYGEPSDCRFAFEVGESYLIYAYAVDDRLEVNNCSRSGQLEATAADQAQLGEGWAPMENVDLGRMFYANNMIAFVAFGGGLLVVGVTAIFLIVRLRKKEG